MKHQKSEWFKGLLYAEHMSKEGWKIDSVDFQDQWVSWLFMESRYTLSGENEWVDGVMDYSQHKVRRLQGLNE